MSEVATEGQMTQAEAAEAISTAVRSDSDFTPSPANMEQGQQSEAQPADQATAPTPGDSPVPGATEFTTPASEDSFMGGDFNPDLLPDELKPGFKQLQAEFTRKTQTLAEQRKELEGLGDVETLRQATEFYHSLQDPEYLKNFYGELGSVVRELGLIEDPAAPEAQVPAEPVAPELSPDLAALKEGDPELAPFLDKFADMEQRLSQFEQAQAQERQALEDERMLMSQAQEIDRQVQVVREQHPEYSEGDWQAIYDRAVAYDGNVLQAAEMFQADRDRIIEGYINQKQTPLTVTPQPGGGTVTKVEHEAPLTLEDAQRQAEAYLNANDLSEFTG